MSEHSSGGPATAAAPRWHPPAQLLQSYADPGGGGLSSVQSVSVEAHLDSCQECRRRLVPVAERDLLDRIGSSLLAQVGQTPQYRRPRFWRTKVTAGLPMSWVLAVLGVTGLAMILDQLFTPASTVRPSLLLLLAPVLPVLIVSVAWMPQLDPLHELTASTPSAGLPVLLRRTVAVLLIAVLPLGGLGVFSTTAPASRWVLPGLALTAGSLALGSVVRLQLAALTLTTGWCLAVVAPSLIGRHVSAALATSMAPLWAAVLLVALAVVVLRRRTYQRA